MPQILSALAAGLIFGLGLCVAGMVDPAKVLAFLDLAGAWDPSLAFVMGGAVAVVAIGYPLVLKRAAPVCADRFQVPSSRIIDMPLMAGSVLFGMGWGLAGLCPGPAIADLTIGGSTILVYLAAMIGGFLLHRMVRERG